MRPHTAIYEGLAGAQGDEAAAQGQRGWEGGGGGGGGRVGGGGERGGAEQGVPLSKS